VTDPRGIISAVQASRQEGHDPPNPSSVLRDLIRSGEAGRLRQAAGISQVTMAAGLGIARANFSAMENGRMPQRYGIGPRYLRVLRGLARHEAVTEEMATAWQVA
jgi:DNA-binding XRE family transcriptional regulator